MRLAVHWQILIALGLAVVVGLAVGADGTLFSISFVSVFDFVGTLFLNALKMLIVPLIVSSIICGMASIGSEQGIGRLGSRTVIYYMVTSLIAIMIGLAMVNLTLPGIVDGEPARDLIGLSDAVGEITEKVEGRGASDVIEVFLRMVPTNIVAAAANGQMLGLIFFSLLFGFFMARLKSNSGDVIRGFWQGVLDVMMLITDWVMKFAPIGVFALVAKIVATTGLDAFRPLAVFFLTVVAALAVHFFVVMPLLLRLVGGVNPLRHYRAMLPAILTAFSTSSSSATLPITMDCVENNAGVSNRTTSFVLPLGATINMDGTALYECVAAMFIAQAYGLELTFTTQFTVVLIALLTSIGVAGIPAASLVAISIILAAIGLPAEAIGLILAVDRVLDMCRTSVNVFSDSCGAVIIGRLEGEQNILKNQHS
ncbi:MAG TPA: dicarboxylate/amino acid:cation symporter [Chromatiaceae bacterium]|jgi:Na+/H+-dicarboxylate symporter|nr:dicarboxylate/amino acid:cation symporter [Chromatiaceae bacterium]HIB84782.1 dicarboxylate/amino acid:cation symporter [Chromatiaceae bacterium]HIN81826.1 dicarboxylate/amino acid:cation symporter [Chromatiales bacterium]HIO15163.1 dicarboxylate/amino acid:cation symporter [Chromatiales bacterium]HIO53985.1 dicarboxylate/amino acid:cation symporter [Chromatiales bacterium]